MSQINIGLTKQHFNTRLYLAYVSYVEKNYPDININQILEKAGIPRSYFEQSNAWVSIEFNYLFNKYLTEAIKEEDFHYKVGRSSFNKNALGPVYYLLKNILSLDDIYKNIWRFTKHINKVIEFTPIDRKAGYLKVSVKIAQADLTPAEVNYLSKDLNVIVKNAMGYYSGFSDAKSLPESKAVATKISDSEYNLEIKFPLERTYIMNGLIGSLTAFGLGAALGYYFTSNYILSFGSGLFSFLGALHTKTKKRQTELLEGLYQTEDTLNKMDKQYRSLVETKIELQRKLLESEAVNEITNSLIQTSSIEEILKLAADKLTSILSFDRVLILLHDEKREFLEVRAFSLRESSLSSKFQSFKLPINIDSKDVTKVSNIYRYGNPVLIEDVKRHIASLVSPESQDLLSTSGSKSFIGVPVKASNDSHGVLLADTFYTDRVLTKDDLSLLTLAARQMAIALEKQIAQNDTIEAYIELGEQAKSYSRFVPFEIINLLGSKTVKDINIKAGRELKMAIVFCDIRGFTTLSERMTPSEAVSFLNSYFSSLAPIIKKHNGIIDKFLGDGIMALFLDPDEAFKACIEFQRSLGTYNATHRTGGSRDAIKTGMGVHFGKVLLGAVGYEDRLSISVVSDAVNLTSRLDGLTKKFGIDVVCSEEAYREAKNKSDFRLIARMQVDGRLEYSNIYEFYGHLSDHEKDLRRQSIAIIEKIVYSQERKEDIIGEIKFTEVQRADPVVRTYQNALTKKAA